MSVIEGSILIKEGRVIDPVSQTDAIMDLVVENGRIKEISEKTDSAQVFDEVINAKEKWVLPGLMDMHVHLREPGREDEETILTGTTAAAAGGFTAVACMPNTDPVTDDEASVRYILRQGKKAKARVLPIGAITKGLAGKELAETGEMVDAGIVAISDDGYGIENANIMRNAMTYAKMFGIPVIAHCEDLRLSNGGCMNEGALSTIMGAKAIPSISEDVMVARDLILAEFLKAPLHIAHVSTAGSICLIRFFKEKGVTVTAETAPHYFTLDERALRSFNTNAKMNPPLRLPTDVKAVKEALADGTIDVIASDHAPHSLEEKDCEFDEAANGVVGLETMLALTYTNLVEPGILTPAQMVEKLSVNPNRILNRPGGVLKVGDAADVTVFDPKTEWTVNPKAFYSKSVNTPFTGMKLKGKASATLVDGKIMFLSR